MDNDYSDVALVSWSARYEPADRERVLNKNDRADIVRDITPWLEAKIAAALCHKTQHAMFLRNTGAPTVAEMVLKTESFHIWKGPLPRGL
jgi:LmbE family N-acetylglucosaminyl deacetylase